MVLGEALAGIALFNTAVAGIKQACGHAKSIGELGGLLDQLWTAEKQVNQQANKRAGYSNFDGFKDVANEAINRRLMQESLNEVRSLITLRLENRAGTKSSRKRQTRTRDARSRSTCRTGTTNKQMNGWRLNCRDGVLGIVALALFVITSQLKDENMFPIVLLHLDTD